MGITCYHWVMVCLAAHGDWGSAACLVCLLCGEGGLLNIQFHKPEDLSNIVNKPAISSAVMGEIEPIRSWSVTYSTDMAICLVFCFFPHSSITGSHPRHWTQAYSFNKLPHCGCFFDALGARVARRTRISSKRRTFLYPSQTVLTDASKLIGLTFFFSEARFLCSCI